MFFLLLEVTGDWYQLGLCSQSKKVYLHAAALLSYLHISHALTGAYVPEKPFSLLWGPSCLMSIEVVTVFLLSQAAVHPLIYDKQWFISSQKWFWMYYNHSIYTYTHTCIIYVYSSWCTFRYTLVESMIHMQTPCRFLNQFTSHLFQHTITQL